MIIKVNITDAEGELLEQVGLSIDDGSSKQAFAAKIVDQLTNIFETAPEANGIWTRTKE